MLDFENRSWTFLFFYDLSYELASLYGHIFDWYGIALFFTATVCGVRS